jgi:hypothetical protein
MVDVPTSSVTRRSVSASTPSVAISRAAASISAVRIPWFLFAPRAIWTT